MPIKECRRRANDAYNAKCDQILIKPLQEDGQKIREAAKAENKSLQRFVLDCIAEHMEKIAD